MGKKKVREIAENVDLIWEEINPDNYLLCKNDYCIQLTKNEFLAIEPYINKVKLRGEI
jgi:hypothetical protein